MASDLVNYELVLTYTLPLGDMKQGDFHQVDFFVRYVTDHKTSSITFNSTGGGWVYDQKTRMTPELIAKICFYTFMEAIDDTKMSYIR